MPSTVSKAVEAADAIVELLNHGLDNDLFEADFEPVRAYRPVLDTGALSDLTVSVIPRGNGLAKETRGNLRNDVTCSIVVQQRVANSSNAVIDPLVLIVQQIADLLASSGLDIEATRYGVEMPNLVREDHLGQNIFTSYIDVTYRLLT